MSIFPQIKSKKGEFTLVWLGAILVVATWAFWAAIGFVIFLIIVGLLKLLFQKAAKGLPKKWETNLNKLWR